jgi:hypothetical protein
MPPAGIPLSGRVPEELLDSPDLATAMAVACSMFRGKEIRPPGFSRRGELIGKGAASGGGPGRLTPGGAGQGLAAPPYGVASP